MARTGHFSRDAEHCRVSQPSLNKQILKLEDEPGERRFDRLRRMAKLTPSGEAFLRRAVRGQRTTSARDGEVHTGTGSGRAAG